MGGRGFAVRISFWKGILRGTVFEVFFWKMCLLPIFFENGKFGLAYTKRSTATS